MWGIQYITKDLALIIHGKEIKHEHYLASEEFLNALDRGLKIELSKKL